MQNAVLSHQKMLNILDKKCLCLRCYEYVEKCFINFDTDVSWPIKTSLRKNQWILLLREAEHYYLVCKAEKCGFENNFATSEGLWPHTNRQTMSSEKSLQLVFISANSRNNPHQFQSDVGHYFHKYFLQHRYTHN
jgi:hypothetical protein